MEFDCAETLEKSRGRIEKRILRSTAILNEYLDWPEVGQVCQITRIVKVWEKTSSEVAYAITSCPPEVADAQTLLAVWRCHWSIENRLHYVRDVSFCEDKSQVRTGQSPEVLAALRNAAIAWLRDQGVTNIAQALRDNAYHVVEVLTKLGILKL